MGKVSEVGYKSFLFAVSDTQKAFQVKVGEDALSFRIKDEKRRYFTHQPTAPPDLIKLMAARGVVFSQVACFCAVKSDARQFSLKIRLGKGE